jgi:hypothetical protein
MQKLELMDVKEVESILFDGTKEEIAVLSGVDFYYYPDTRDFDFNCCIYDKVISVRMHKCFTEPSCVRHFGNSYTFT